MTLDHPLIDQNNMTLRQRVVKFIKSSYSVNRSSNIIFVCGGNDQAHMRMQFVQYCRSKLEEFDVFLPEYAMKTVFDETSSEPFNIADFESYISQWSHAIVIFPEAPGSFAETGYFAAIEKIAKRCILVLDLAHQHKDSFISLGPANNIGKYSIFHPIIQINYRAPDFDPVAERIKRIQHHINKKKLSLNKFKELSAYELFCLVHEVVNLLTIATTQDILYMFRAIFSGRIMPSGVKRALSILVGSKYLCRVGEFGHMCINSDKPRLLYLNAGNVAEEREIRLSIAALYQDADKEFIDLVEASRRVD